MTRARELSRLGNSNAITANSSNEVGIGTDSPDRQLDVGTGDLIVGAAITLGGSSGIISATKFSGGWDGTLSIDDSTSSTSKTTGALVITGGVGIAKSLFVGEGISVGGTITYDDVTNIDSVGIVTAGKGLRATTGGIIVTAGVGTYKGDVELHGNQGVTSVSFDQSDNSLKFVDDAKLKLGTGGDLEIYHSNNNWNYITSPNNRNLSINPVTGEAGIQVYANGAVQLYHDNAKKLETGSAGVTVTGNIYTDGNVNLTADDKKVRIGDGEDLQLYHDGTNSHVQNTTGTLLINQSGVGVSVYGSLKLQNGLLRENVNRNTSAAANAATALNLDNGMVHWFTTNLGAANVKMNVVSGAGINTDMAIGDMISVTIMTKVNSTSNFIEQVRVDGVEASAGVTTYWAGGSAPTDGGGTGVDTYAFNILKTGNGTYDMIANQVKGS